MVSITDAKNRWLTDVPEKAKATLIPQGWFEKWPEATFDKDSWGKMQTPKKLRAPNGTVQDSREYWSVGKVLYEPKNIRVPVMLIHAE